jgi:hypothetical protein
LLLSINELWKDTQKPLTSDMGAGRMRIDGGRKLLILILLKFSIL